MIRTVREHWLSGVVVMFGYALLWMLVATAVHGGEISPAGATIEVQDIRCEVKSDYRIECVNIGRVCVAYREQEATRTKKIFGCAIEGSPNYPCPPWEERTAQITENVKRFGHCTPLTMGGF